jgi:homoprotocatechuate degradation regulator HpaR
MILIRIKSGPGFAMRAFGKKQDGALGGGLGRRNLPLMLLQAREALLQHFRPIFQHYNMTEQQWRILRVVNDHDRLGQHEIASLCQISGPSLSNILSRLEEVGYVGRQRSREDQRTVFVTLTRRGSAFVAQVAPDIDAQYRSLEKALGANLMAALFDVLDRLLEHGRKVGIEARVGRTRQADR